MIIDKEFQMLIPPLTKEEYDCLEKNIIKEGCRDSLVVWGEILIDGHNRYEICTKHNIPFDTLQIDFESREKAKEWIILNQFGRRNIPAFVRAELALKLKPIIAEKARERMIQGVRSVPHADPVVNLPQGCDKGKTRDELAKIAKTSSKNISKVEKIIEHAPEEVKEQLRRGEMSINRAYNEVVKKPHVAMNSGNNEWYTPSEIIEAARTAMGSIDIDPASNDIAQQTVKAKIYYTVDTNGLAQKWDGNVWLNPPYSSELIEKFIDKLVAEKSNYRQAVILVNNATETGWFNKIVSIASAVCFPKSRVKFYMPDGKTGAPLQGQAILYIGKDKASFVSSFSSLGWIANELQ